MLMVAFLLAALWWVLRSYRLGQAAHNWQPVKATILVVHIQERDDDGQQQSAPYIKYRYRFRNRHFTSTRLQYGDLWSSDYAESCAMIHGLHSGDDVQVLVNPGRPGQVVVFPGYCGHLLQEIGIITAGILLILLI
jgi:hypothetical protein